MANWTPGGFIGQMFKAIARHIAPSGMPAPVLWGDEATVRDRLREGIADLKCALHVYHFDYPFPPDAVVEFFRTNYGPMSRARSHLSTWTAKRNCGVNLSDYGPHIRRPWTILPRSTPNSLRLL